jgi:hypothetical protein
VPELLAEQRLDVGLVVNNENEQGHGHASALRYHPRVTYMKWKNFM